MKRALERLVSPLAEALACVEGPEEIKDRAVAALLRACGREDCSFWAWDDATWLRIFGPTQADFLVAHDHHLDGHERQFLMAAAYRLGCWTDVRAVGDFKRVGLAEKVFGRTAVNAAITAVSQIVSAWGYARVNQSALPSLVCETLLLNRSPLLEDLTAEFLEEFRRDAVAYRRGLSFQFGRALAALGVLAKPLPIAQVMTKQAPFISETADDIDAEWAHWVKRWDETSTLTAGTRETVCLCLRKAGRWLRSEYPHITSPAQWDRELAAAYVGVLVRMKIGDFIGGHEPGQSIGNRRGQSLSAHSKSRYLSAIRMAFRDWQEWGWLKPRFDPGRVFATPRSVKALIGPAPRTIAADVWAKLLWAGLNLATADLPANYSRRHYPVELLQALSVVWLFAGLRSDEIVRLRLGCVRWQLDDALIPFTSDILPKNAVCLLDVPVNKTAAAFTKPVDPVVGQAIAKWEKVRPQQPVATDRKTDERVDLLFCHRARPVPRQYLNGSLIPVLCRKAGVPLRDVRGSITSHRARATIASQLFNAREPMSLFELQAWLGHRSPATTQHYVAITPTRLAKAYADAGYFSRNLRAIDVLIDQDSIRTGAAASGAPWRYYDLGHGLCTYEFFDQCPHRMACARCDFFVPKLSGLAQLIEAKDSLVRLQQQVPLSDEECAAANGDLQAVEHLLTTLANQPTPSGQTPLQLAHRPNQPAFDEFLSNSK